MRSRGARPLSGTAARPTGAARIRTVTLALVTVALVLAGAACSGNSGKPKANSPSPVKLYGSDGNMSNSFGADFKTPGVISGMAGTAPLTKITDDFKRRLLSVDPGLQDFNYSGETYDAVVISALAAQLARSVDPTVVSKYINGVTILGPNGQECSTIKDCLDTIAAGQDIAYRGITVHSGFTDVGEPSTTSYGTLHFGRNNKIDDGKTEFVTAGSDATASKDQGPAPADQTVKYRGDPLRFGILLPKTGALAYLGPAMFAGAHLAIREINEAGGILGKPVEVVDSDDATDATKAAGNMDKLVQAGIPIIIGPATSGESAALIPKAVATNRILFSPSATSAALSKADDHGLFFRTAPPDAYQSQALADVIMRGGAQKVYIVARADAYGTGLLDGVKSDLIAAGIKAGNIGTATYRDDQKNYSDIASGVAGFGPDSVLVVGYEESAQVIQAIKAAGVTFTQS